jgi:hypothetical protein
MVASNGVTFILNFVKTGQLVQEIKEVTRNPTLLRSLKQERQGVSDT